MKLRRGINIKRKSFKTNLNLLNGKRCAWNFCLNNCSLWCWRCCLNLLLNKLRLLLNKRKRLLGQRNSVNDLLILASKIKRWTINIYKRQFYGPFCLSRMYLMLIKELKYLEVTTFTVWPAPDWLARTYLTFCCCWPCPTCAEASSYFTLAWNRKSFDQ